MNTFIFDPDPDPATIIPAAIAQEYYPDGEVKGSLSVPSRMDLECCPLMLSHGGWLEIKVF